MRIIGSSIFSLWAISFVWCVMPVQAFGYNEMMLKENWVVAASANVNMLGQSVSKPAFDVSHWHKTTVPSTVMATLVKNGLYKDLYVGDNLEKVDRNQFKSSWWYRTEFEIKEIKDFNELIFEGINYRADIWINGKQAFSKDSIFGTFRIFKLDVGPFLVKGKNVLAIEIYPSQPGEPTLGFVDWNPRAPDDNMGLWRPVKLRQTGAVSVENVFVYSDIDKKEYKEADLSIVADLVNHKSESITSRIKIKIEGIELEKVVKLHANETKHLRFSADSEPELKIQNPRIWWPVNMGKPELYKLDVTVWGNHSISDEKSVRFGIRKIDDYLTKNGDRGYKINGVPMIIRGGGWVDDLLLADSEKKVKDQLNYVLQMNLNTIRLEGFWGNSDELYSLADEMGILVMVGWSCQWEWKDYFGAPDDQFGCIKTPEDMDLVSKSMKDQVLWLRNHPSIFTWVLGSDKLPRPELEMRYHTDFKESDPSRPLLLSCKMLKSVISGTSGVKMAGPYDYVTPNYWYVDTKNGGAFGFNTETGPGPQPVPYESLLNMLPKEHLWPIDTMWNYHCGRNQFHNMDRYIDAFDNRYGKCKSAKEFCYKAQIANFEAIRAMFEAFSVNKPKTTGVIQWMLNSAWPEQYWQLYDYYLMPNGAFYGARIANRPLNIVYNYGNDSVYLTNDLVKTFNNLEAQVQIYNLDGTLKHQMNIDCKANSNSSQAIGQLPGLNGLSNVYFVDLMLKEKGSSSIICENFYWLSAQKDELDFPKTDWYYTPISKYADFKDLNTMPKVKIEVHPIFEKIGKNYILTVKLKNKTQTPAMFIELGIKGKRSGRSVLPVFWDDNYISLMPGKEKEVKARFSPSDLGQDTPELDYQGWNLE